MSGVDENVAKIGDSMPMNSIPRTFLSSLMSKSPNHLSLGSAKQEVFMESQGKSDETINEFPGDLSLWSSAFAASHLQGSFVDGAALTIGYCPHIDQSHLRAPQLLSSQVPSPFMAFKSGITPTVQFDSPMFPPMFRAGPVAHFLNTSLTRLMEMSHKGDDQIQGNGAPHSFSFEPHLYSSSSHATAATDKTLASLVGPEYYQEGSNHRAEAQDIKERILGSSFARKKSDSATANEQSLSLDDRLDIEGKLSPTPPDDAAVDGYVWRKYGQKQVKGNEHPRSYYRCTQLNCPAKKKVDCSCEGYVMEIIYKGVHNHPKPSVNIPGNPSSQPFDELTIGSSDCQASLNWRNDSLEATSSASLNNSICKPAEEMQGRDCGTFGSSDALDALSVKSGMGDYHQAVCSSSHGSEMNGDVNETKKRKLEACATEFSLAARTAAESKVAVQTVSDVDVLDDGYRWRKYGQKVVKGNPNPRSYYKCTSPGCSVRKHVERASHDIKFVLTTYEGKHNHDVPATRSSKEAASIASDMSSFMLYANSFQGEFSTSDCGIDRIPVISGAGVTENPASLSRLPYQASGAGFTLNGVANHLNR